MNKVFIGSKNNAKIKDWKDYLCGMFKVLDPYVLDINIEVAEGIVSVQKNSRKKAIAWCKESNMVTISDDTGFYINALGGKPGVAVRRWGGQLPESTSNEEFFEFLKNKISDISDTSCYFGTCISIATPSGNVYQINHKTHGHIDKSQLGQRYVEGYPLGLIFKARDRDKVWNDMTIKEKRESDNEMVDETMSKLQEIYSL